MHRRHASLCSDERRRCHEKAGCDCLVTLAWERFAPRGQGDRRTIGERGPVGREATAETDVALKAKILSYSRSKGVFGGVSLQGTTLHQDEGAIKAVYGKQLDASDILGGGVTTPPAAVPLNQVLTKYSAKGF